MFFSALRNLLALLSLLHFVSGPTQYVIALLSLMRRWYCMWEYVLFMVMGRDFSSTCDKVFVLQAQAMQ